jgi:chromosome segregation ATPase
MNPPGVFKGAADFVGGVPLLLRVRRMIEFMPDGIERRVFMKKIGFLVLNLLLAVFFISPCFSATPAAGGKEAVIQQIKDIDIQLAQVRADIQKLLFQKAGLNDQIAVLRAQKHINKLNKKQQDLSAELQALQAKKGTVKIDELNDGISVLNKELALQNDMLSLMGQLKDAHAAMNKDTAKSIEAQIKGKREAIKALYPVKPGVVPANAAPAGLTMSVKPAASPAPEDSDIQAFLDQIKSIDDRIKAYKDKMAALKAQREQLKEQLKNMK